MVHKLNLPPDQASYAVDDGDEVIRTQLEGGAGKYRVDILNATRTVNCQWTVGPDNFRYLRAFYNTLHRLSEPFKTNLYLDYAELTEHDCWFIPGTFKLASQTGLTFVVVCQLEVVPTDNPEEDLSLVEIMDSYESIEEANQILNLLEKLVNVDLPTVA